MTKEEHIDKKCGSVLGKQWEAKLKMLADENGWISVKDHAFEPIHIMRDAVQLNAARTHWRIKLLEGVENLKF